MPNPYFRFQQFTVRQDLCAMKVGTDGVLLGAWADVAGCKTILDIGTGTGLIALMLAQRSQTSIIDAIDLDEQAFRQAQINFRESPFNNRLTAYHCNLQNYQPAKVYDLIVSNPPYFNNSLPSSHSGRTLARHDNTLPPDELFFQSIPLLSAHGKIALIFPYDRMETIDALSKQQQLSLLRKVLIYPTTDSKPKRFLAEFTLNQPPLECKETTLVIEESRHHYSPAFRDLTKEFYLNK